MHRMPWAGPLARSIGCVAGALLTGYLLDEVGLAGRLRSTVDVAVALAAALLTLALLRGDLRTLIAQARRVGAEQ
jgi:hypothetical protein